MALFPTGRSRSAAVVVQSSQSFVSGSQVPAVGGGFSNGFNSTWANALGMALQVSHSVSGKGFEQDLSYPGPGVRFRYYINVTWTITLGGVGVGAPISTITGAAGPWIVAGSYPGLGSPLATYLEGSIAGTLAANWMLTEQCNDASLAPAQVLTETAGAGTASLTVTGSFTFRLNGPGAGASGHIVTPVFVYSDTYTPAWDGSYGAGVNFNTLTSISNGSSVTVQGVQFTGEVNLSAGGAKLHGNGLAAALTKTTKTSFATASLSSLPDWALDMSAANFAYESGDPMTVGTRHYCGDTLLSSGNGSHRYPASGYTSNITATLSDLIQFNPQTDSYNRDYSLFNCDGLTGDNLVRVDPEWADGYGTYPDSAQFLGSFPASNPGLNSQYGFQCGPEFDGMTLRVEGTHRFLVFADDSRIEMLDGTKAADAGGVKVTGNWITSAATSGYVFKPFGYRFYRFRAKASAAGAQFTIQTTRKTGSVEGLDTAASYYWDFTLGAADTWQAFEIDLCFPDRSFDAYNFPLNPAERHAVQPAEYGLFPDDTSLGATLGTAADFWFADFDGFHKSGSGRIPALLIGPCSSADPTEAVAGQAPVTVDSCAGFTANASKVPGGTFWGRLVTNGAMTWNINGGPGKLAPEVDNLIAAFDDAANDTGIHLTNPNALWSAAATWESGWVTRRPLWAELALDQELTLMAVHRTYAHGYYGSGNTATGEYGPALALSGDKVWNGELLGLAHSYDASVPGASLTLIDDDTSALRRAGSANADGLYRLFGKYGAVHPYSSAPYGSECADRKQYSGVVADESLTYTALGRNLNAYWVRSRYLRARDSQDRSNSFYAPDRCSILDRFPAWRDFACYLPGLANLSVPLMNWYLEAWTENGNVQVGFAPSVMPPFQYTTQVTSGGDAGYPELYHCRSRIYALWQQGTRSPAVYRAYSDDWARSWSVPEVAFVSGKYPRAATCPQTLTTVEFAYFGGAILAQRQTPGMATPGPVFYPAGIGALADESFDAVWVADGRRTLLLLVNDGTEIQRYVSYDQGTSFKLVV